MQDQYFYGHGKLLLSGEYFVLDGAQALALPTTVGQSLKVKHRQSYRPSLNWKSFDHMGNLWFEGNYEFWHFKPLKPTECPTETFISGILKAARGQNPHFLRDDVDVFVETKVEFPLEWGLGSSSSLIYNIAQWAYVGPFELLKNTMGGSGYDIACAQALGPIKYVKFDGKPQWEAAAFSPSFKDQIFFIYSGQKQNSQKEVSKYQTLKIENKSQIISEISQLTREMIHAQELRTFNKVISAHEEIVSKVLGYEKVKDLYFHDFWGEVKSLGAWGGDFLMATSDRSAHETREYFAQKGFSTVIPFRELIYSDVAL
jgi:mevalonate kinase